MRVRIISKPIEGIFPSEQPTFEYGGQNSGFGLDLGKARFNANMPLSQTNPFSTKNTLDPVDEEISNSELEKSEVVVGDFDQDGVQEHLTVGGKRHSQGGTPAFLPGGAFVYSDTKAMKIKDPIILKHFGKSGSKALTPAAIAKQYKLNEYKAILNDPNSDKLQKKTAQLNMDNSLAKLQDLAIVNEQKKGFPQGIPQIGASDEGIVEAKYGGKYQLGGGTGFPLNEFSVSAKRPQSQQPFRFDQTQVSNEWQVPTFSTQQPQTSGYNPFTWAQEMTEPEMRNQPGFPQSFDQTYNPYVAPQSTNPEPGTPNLSNPSYKNYGASRGDNFARLAAGYALANTQRYAPYAAPIPQPNLINPTYMSPEREIAAIQENASMQGMLGAYTQPGQSQRSNNSSTQGQALSGIANTVGRYSNANVDIANKVAAQNADTLNKYNFEKAARLTNLAAQSNEYDSRYRDAINQRLGNMAKVEKGVETDIMNLNALNAINPNYEYDPRSRTIKFKKGPHDLGSGAGQGEDIGQQLSQATSIIKRSNPGISDEDARRMAFDYIKAQKYKTTSNMYNPRKTTTQQSGTQHYSYPDYD